MRKGVLVAAGLAILAAVSWDAAPAQAIAISAPAALKSASDSVKLTETVHCWGCGYGGGYYRPYYRPYFYRPYYRPYYRSYYYSDYDYRLPALLGWRLRLRLWLRLLRPAAAVLRRPERLLVLAAQLDAELSAACDGAEAPRAGCAFASARR